LLRPAGLALAAARVPGGGGLQGLRAPLVFHK